MARDRAVDHWLRDQVAPAYDALTADPSRAVSVKQVRALLAAEHERARGSGEDLQRRLHAGSRVRRTRGSAALGERRLRHDRASDL
jgi:hypothetical protein